MGVVVYFSRKSHLTYHTVKLCSFPTLHKLLLCAVLDKIICGHRQVQFSPKTMLKTHNYFFCFKKPQSLLKNVWPLSVCLLCTSTERTLPSAQLINSTIASLSQLHHVTHTARIRSDVLCVSFPLIKVFFNILITISTSKSQKIWCNIYIFKNASFSTKRKLLIMLNKPIPNSHFFFSKSEILH